MPRRARSRCDVRLTIVRLSNKVRSGTEQWIAEAVAAAGLLAHMEEQLITIKFVLPDASVAKASP